MISLPRITRLAAAQRFDVLLDEVLANGRPLPLALRLRLASDPETLPAIALALGLQRFLELTLGPTPQATALARALLDRRRPGGSGFGDAAANAAALAALLALREHGSGGFGSPDDLEVAIDEAREALRTTLHRSPSTLTGRPLLSDELDTCVVLWQLAGHADAADDLDLAALLTTLEDLGLRHDPALAPVLVRAEAALATAGRCPTPTLAA